MDGISGSEVKRVRGGLQAPDRREMDNAEPLSKNVIKDFERMLDPMKTVRFFSLNQQKLS
jgi:hypothetical protein